MSVISVSLSLSLSSGPLSTARVLRVREGRYRRLRAEVGGGGGGGPLCRGRPEERAEEAPLSVSLSLQAGPQANPSLIASVAWNRMRSLRVP